MQVFPLQALGIVAAYPAHQFEKLMETKHRTPSFGLQARHHCQTAELAVLVNVRHPCGKGIGGPQPGGTGGFGSVHVVDQKFKL